MAMASENFAPQVVSRLMAEVRDLVRNAPAGIEYQDGESSSVSEIHAVIQGPEETPYVGGRFRLKLVISEEYPSAPPRGYFITKIFHPNIAINGDICVNTLKKDWTPAVTLKHVLQVIRCLLIVPFPESALNDEAGKLFMDSYEEFSTRARIMTQVHAIPNTKAGAGAATDNADADGAESATAEGGSAAGAATEEDDTTRISAQKKKDAKKKSLKRL